MTELSTLKLWISIRLSLKIRIRGCPPLIGLDRNLRGDLIISLGKILLHYQVATHPAERMDETVEVQLLSSDITHAYSTVLYTGCRAGDNISRESVDVGFIIFAVVNERDIRKEVTDSTK